MAKIIIIAEQSEIIRKGLVYLIEGYNYFGKIIEIACASVLEDNLNKYCPDVLLINPALTGAGFVRSLPEQCMGKLKVGAIVYSLFDDEVMSQFDEIIMIGDNRSKIQKKINGLLIGEGTAKASKSPKTENSLSARETDVLKLLVKGHSNKEISDKLFISTHTVISHRKNITQKLSIKSVAGLTVYAILNEVISMDEVQ